MIIYKKDANDLKLEEKNIQRYLNKSNMLMMSIL